MRTRLLALTTVIAGLVGAVTLLAPTGERDVGGEFTPPEGAIVSYFPAKQHETGPPLVISASIEAGFMRPFLLAFQRTSPTVSIAYIQSRSNAFLDRALAACHQGERTADMYLTSSTDHLVRLANENCARTLPTATVEAAPARAAWRDQVVAFSVEPAAFVFGRDAAAALGPIPTNHTSLLEWLRRLPARERTGTYDIEASADGYNFASADSRQASLYGRVLEGLGRSDIKLYCCSNVMVDAVDRGEVLFAYNVQLSYAYNAQRAGSRIRVVLPNDYQAVQTLSMMVPTGARAPSLADQLAAFLVSAEARKLAVNDLAPPGETRAAATAHAEQLLQQASVTPLLLSLQDRARRQQLIGEWREAVRRPGPREPDPARAALTVTSGGRTADPTSIPKRGKGS